MATQIPSTTSSSTVEDEFAGLLDVVIFDASCMDSSDSCDAEHIVHLVEYYGADWCEPCELIEDDPRVAIAEFTPMIRPWASTNAPPELPGLIEASV